MTEARLILCSHTGIMETASQPAAAKNPHYVTLTVFMCLPCHVFWQDYRVSSSLSCCTVAAQHSTSPCWIGYKPFVHLTHCWPFSRGASAYSDRLFTKKTEMFQLYLCLSFFFSLNQHEQQVPGWQPWGRSLLISVAKHREKTTSPLTYPECCANGPPPAGLGRLCLGKMSLSTCLA